MHDLNDLLTLMARLRDPQDGCPWDIKQTAQSIAPHTLEEAYEVVDAIERQDWSHLKDELGDLLFQVVFLSRLGEEAGAFAFADVVDNVVAKLLRRHPHVFPQGTLDSRLPEGTRLSDAQIKANWDRIKAEERAAQAPQTAEAAPASHLDGMTRSLPALRHAEKLQQRASRQGFDWPDVEPVFAKWQEEIEELHEAWNHGQGDHDRIEDEFGDVLFVAVNLARFLRVDPETALRRTNAKFERRFRRMETLLAARGKVMSEQSLDDLDALWNQAKREQG